MFKLPWMEEIEGMKEIYGDRDDQYRIHYTPDIVYAVHGVPLRLQLLTMRNPEKGKCYPLVVYVTGSGWQTQDIYDRLPQMVEIARCGYVVATVEYRNTDNGNGFPCQIQDIKSAIRFLRKYADEYRIDSQRVALWGDSSGAHTALMAAFTGDDEFCEADDPEYSAKVSCVIDFFAPTNFENILLWQTHMSQYIHTEDFAGPMDLFIKNTPPKYSQHIELMSPLYYIQPDKLCPPVLIMHGDMDDLVPFHQSVELYQKLKQCGQYVDFYKIQCGKHGFHFWTEQTMDIVKKFLKRCL